MQKKQKTMSLLSLWLSCNLVPRVSHLTGGKMRDPGNEVGLSCTLLDLIEMPLVVELRTPLIG